MKHTKHTSGNASRASHTRQILDALLSVCRTAGTITLDDVMASMPDTGRSVTQARKAVTTWVSVLFHARLIGKKSQATYITTPQLAALATDRPAELGEMCRWWFGHVSPLSGIPDRTETHKFFARCRGKSTRKAPTAADAADATPTVAVEAAHAVRIIRLLKALAQSVGGYSVLREYVDALDL